MCVVVHAGRRDQAAKVHRRKTGPEGAEHRARATGADGPLRRKWRLPPTRTAAIFWRGLPAGKLRRVRQLRFSAPDLRWDARGTEVSLVHLSYPPAERF